MRTIIPCLLLTITIALMYPCKAFPEDGGKQAGIESTDAELIVTTEEKILSGLTEEESEWYERFNEGVMFLDGWNEIAGNILDIFPEDTAARNELFVRMLGIKIGSEWCRDNEVRQINTQMLKQWGEKIRNAVAKGPETTERILKEINSEVDRLLELSNRKSLFSPQS